VTLHSFNNLSLPLNVGSLHGIKSELKKKEKKTGLLLLLSHSFLTTIVWSAFENDTLKFTCNTLKNVLIFAV